MKRKIEKWKQTQKIEKPIPSEWPLVSSTNERVLIHLKINRTVSCELKAHFSSILICQFSITFFHFKRIILISRFQVKPFSGVQCWIQFLFQCYVDWTKIAYSWQVEYHHHMHDHHHLLHQSKPFLFIRHVHNIRSVENVIKHFTKVRIPTHRLHQQSKSASTYLKRWS